MKINLIGIPTNLGANYSGTEILPSYMRENGLIKKMKDKGIEIDDFGDIELPIIQPRHNIPPIRNYPGPRIVWDEIVRTSKPLFKENTFSLLLGGDCSIIVGTVTNLYKQFGEDCHVLIIDAHVDDLAPNSEQCVGAAAMGLWFLTNQNKFWPHLLPGSLFTVLGSQENPKTNQSISTISLQQLRENGIKESMTNILSSIGNKKKIFIHFDVDVINEIDMPAAYMPSKIGLSLQEANILLNELVSDSRVIGMELTEFSPLKDPAGDVTSKLIETLVTIFDKRSVGK